MHRLSAALLPKGYPLTLHRQPAPFPSYNSLITPPQNSFLISLSSPLLSDSESCIYTYFNNGVPPGATVLMLLCWCKCNEKTPKHSLVSL